MFCMSDVIAVRVPKKLKDELQELNMEYADDVRECLERKVKAEKLKRLMKDIDEFRNEIAKKTGITASSADIIPDCTEAFTSLRSDFNVSWSFASSAATEFAWSYMPFDIINLFFDSST